MSNKYSKIVNDIIKKVGVDKTPDVEKAIAKKLEDLQASHCVTHEWASEPKRRRLMAARREERKNKSKKAGRRGRLDRRIIFKKEGRVRQGHPTQSGLSIIKKVTIELHATKGWRIYGNA